MTVFNVAISAGHHPGAKGAVYQGVTEYDEAVKWQAAIIDYLNTKHVNTYLHMRAYMIGTGTLTKKVDEVNAIKNCDLALEVHFNATGDPKVSGSETLYYPGSEQGLAYGKIVQRHIANAMNNRSRGVKEGWHRQDRPDRVDFDGDVEGDEVIVYWLRKIRCPALIVEPEFIGQYENIRARQDECCAAIGRAIQEIALEKHRLYNLPPEERPSGIR